MAVKNDIAVYINGINYTKKLVYPMKFSFLLDESLDEGAIALRHVKREIFQPLTPVEIRVRNTVYWGKTVDKVETATYYYVIAGDTVEEVPTGSGLYNHDIALVEATKVAECIIVDTLTVTNDIGRVYTDSPSPVVPVQTEG